jgi:hypothetical protein
MRKLIIDCSKPKDEREKFEDLTPDEAAKINAYPAQAKPKTLSLEERIAALEMTLSK